MTKNQWVLLLAVIGFSTGAPRMGRAAQPQTLNYQGRMTLTSGGLPVPDSSGQTVTFALWTGLTGGTSVWNEAWTGKVATKNGLFNVILGTNGSPVPASIFNQPLWLEITWYNSVSSITETLAPRQALTSAPYSFSSKQLELPYLQSQGATLGNFLISVSQTTVSNGGGGILAYGSASNTAAVKGVSYDTSFPAGPNAAPGRGVEGQGPVGVVGFGTGAGSIGLVGQIAANGDTNSAGVLGFANPGVGVRGQGVTGVAGSTSSPNGVGVDASSNGNSTALALHSTGGAVFDIFGAGSTVTFNASVIFNGSVTGIGGATVPVPLGLSNTTAGPIIQGSNAGNGAGMAAIGTALALSASAKTSTVSVPAYGISVTAQALGGGVAATAYGVYAIAHSSSATNYAIYGVSEQGANGVGVYGEGSNVGIQAVGDGSAPAFNAQANSGVAIQGVSANYRGAEINGRFIGVSATATDITNGQAFVGSNQSQQATAELNNDGSGPALRVKSAGPWSLSATTSASPGVAVYGEGLVINSSGIKGYTSGASGYGVWGTTNNPSGTGVLAQQTGAFGNALDVEGSAIFNSAANAVTFNSAVFFNGPVSGLNITAPLSLTGSSTPAIYAFNSGGSTAMIVSGTTNSGGVLTVRNNSAVNQAYGLFSIANGAALTRTGIVGTSDTNYLNPFGPAGVYGYSASGLGVIGVINGSNNASAGVEGLNYGAPNTGAGVRGENINATGYGVLARNTSATGAGVALSATSDSPAGVGVYTRVSGTGYALKAINDNGYAIAAAGGLSATASVGEAIYASSAYPGSTGATVDIINTATNGRGLLVSSSSSMETIVGSNATGSGIVGEMGVDTPGAFGVLGRDTGGGGAQVIGVWGAATTGNPSSIGVYGSIDNATLPSTYTAGVAVLGNNPNAAGIGVLGLASAVNGVGVVGQGKAIGVSGVASSTTAGGIGVRGHTNALSGGQGVFGTTNGGQNVGVMGVYNTSDQALPTLGVGIFGSNDSAGAAIYGRNETSGPAMIAVGATLGISATASNATGIAVYAGGNSSTSTGLLAYNPATLSQGSFPLGAALSVSGAVKTTYESFTATAATATSVPTTNYGPGGHIYLTGIVAVSTITVTNTLITPTSVIIFNLFGFGASPPTTGYIIGVSPGSFVVKLGTAVTFGAPTGFNYMIIN